MDKLTTRQTDRKADKHRQSETDRQTVIKSFKKDNGTTPNCIFKDGT